MVEGQRGYHDGLFITTHKPLAFIIHQHAHLARGAAGDERIADAERTALNEGGGHCAEVRSSYAHQHWYIRFSHKSTLVLYRYRLLYASLQRPTRRRPEGDRCLLH